MNAYLRKHHLHALGVFLLASVVGLWSWNTLSDLFDLPLAQYRHILALLFLALFLKWFLSPLGCRPQDAVGARHAQPTD
ncbi:MAG: hypothetical protein P8103_05895 [Candidatus Thiodiazotropha sp.]